VNHTLGGQLLDRPAIALRIDHRLARSDPRVLEAYAAVLARTDEDRLLSAHDVFDHRALLQDYQPHGSRFPVLADPGAPVITIGWAETRPAAVFSHVNESAILAAPSRFGHWRLRGAPRAVTVCAVLSRLLLFRSVLWRDGHVWPTEQAFDERPFPDVIALVPVPDNLQRVTGGDQQHWPPPKVPAPQGQLEHGQQAPADGERNSQYVEPK
jgi:hypothetical protein